LISLRAAAPRDAGALATLIRRAFAAQPATLPAPSALGVTAQSVAAHLATGGALVAEATGDCVGAVLWRQENRSLRLSRLAVDPAWRRQGIARMLLEDAARHARQGGLMRLVLATRVSLSDNRRLFASAGYVEVSLGRHDGFAEPTFIELEQRLP
jgi:GNAT superfamily N-acetyltransferase